MLQYEWKSIEIYTNKDANDMVNLFQTLNPTIGAFDTETDGLHIILNKPFVVQFGFLHPTEKLGYTFAVDLQRTPVLARTVLSYWGQLATTLTKYLAHNIKFDLHMLTNIGLPYTTENLSDTMFYIRYAHDALKTSAGGPPLKLKDYATRYIDHHAKFHENKIRAERHAIAADYNLRLKRRLNNCGKPPVKYGAKSYTLGVIKTIFKDATFELTDLSVDTREAYLTWLQTDLPIYLQHKVNGLVKADMIPYTILDRKNLLQYAHFDIIYVLEIYLLLDPVVQYRENMKGIEIEESNILPLYEMERVGFAADKEYLEQSRRKLKNYIRERRAQMFELVGQEFTIGQHKLIKSILNDDFEVPLTSTNGDELDIVKTNLIQSEDNPLAVEFINAIQELRTLEKWYSAYIIRFLKDLVQTDRLYTTIHQVGTVTGRVTSDFQQFPKHAIVSNTGEELFFPRKMIKTSGGDYNALVYLDYSQIELRFQAFYTILVGHPDLNLCRAYMPFKCEHHALGLFDFNNPEHINKHREDWTYCESPGILWHPTDVHAATTVAATGVDPSDPHFKDLRGEIGKRVNFAKNYGAQWGRMRIMFPNKTDEEITRINDAYYIAFPGVKYYHDYCYGRANNYSYTENLFGVKYYGISGHKLINQLIQGSAAFYLKIKIRELYDYAKANNIKSKWQMQVHDELSFERHKDENQVFFDFKRIMEDWPDTLVPIIADMEVSTTTWAEKKGVETLDELQIRLGN